MMFPINLFANCERLLIVLFSLIVLTKGTANSSQVEETCRYATMEFTKNFYANCKRLLIVFFSLIILTKVIVDSSQVVVASRYVTMVFTISLFSDGQRLLKVFFSLIVPVKIPGNKAVHSKIIRFYQLFLWLVIKISNKTRA